MPNAENTVIWLSPEMKELPRLIEFLKMQAIPPSDAMAVEMAGEELFTNTVRTDGPSRMGRACR